MVRAKGGTAMIIDLLLILAADTRFVTIYRDGELFIEPEASEKDANHIQRRAIEH